MASTYTLISSNVLSSAAASVTFSAIPSTYTDLVLRWSVRSTSTPVVRLSIKPNSDTSSLSWTRIQGNGATASSSTTADVQWLGGAISGSSDTANTFGSGELYIPNYTVAQNKPASAIGVSENNATTAYVEAFANLWQSTTVISSLLIAATGGNLNTGSSFYLYGIKNS
jgi:hypothetical protein